MIRLLDDLPEHALGVEATGRVTDAPYETVLIPAVRTMRATHARLRLVSALGADFDGWSMGAMWEDAKLGHKDPTAWEKVAIVSDNDWVRHTVKAFGWMVPGEVRVFALTEFDAARDWVAG